MEDNIMAIIDNMYPDCPDCTGTGRKLNGAACLQCGDRYIKELENALRMIVDMPSKFPHMTEDHKAARMWGIAHGILHKPKKELQP
jgi:hypothetical protein